MKSVKIIVLLVMTSSLMQSCFVKSRPNMDFVDRHHLSRETEVVSLNIPTYLVRPFVKNALKDGDEEQELIRFALEKLKRVKMMTLSNVKNDGVMKSFQMYIKRNRFEEMASLYSDGSRISINGKFKGDRIKRLMLGIADDEDLIFVDIKADLSINELSEMIRHYEDQQQKKRKM
jgi:hypothetical protein